jgi:hypothetical protein
MDVRSVGLQGHGVQLRAGQMKESSEISTYRSGRPGPGGQPTARTEVLEFMSLGICELQRDKSISDQISERGDRSSRPMSVRLCDVCFRAEAFKTVVAHFPPVLRARDGTAFSSCRSSLRGPLQVRKRGDEFALHPQIKK